MKNCGEPVTPLAAGLFLPGFLNGVEPGLFRQRHMTFHLEQFEEELKKEKNR